MIDEPSSLSFGETMLRISTKNKERFAQATDLDVGIGGTESNFSIAFSQMGGESAWLSRLTDNFLGTYITTNIKQFGVDVSKVKFTDDGKVGVYYLEMGSEPRPTDVVYDRENTAISKIDPDEVDWSLVNEYDLFFTTGITVALSENCKESVFRTLEKAGEETEVFFDLNYRSKLWPPKEAKKGIEFLLSEIDILSVTESDARKVLDESGNYADIVEELDEKYGLDVALMSRSSEGAVAFSGGEVYESDPYEIDVVDRIGAGDAFDAAFAYRYLVEGDVGDALDWGVAAAAFAHTIPGDIVYLDRGEIEGLLERKREMDINR